MTSLRNPVAYLMLKVPLSFWYSNKVPPLRYYSTRQICYSY